VVVTVNTPPSITSVTGVDPTCSTLCDGSATVVASGSDPLTYSWTNSTGTTSTLNNLCAGTYNVTVTDANGCVTQGSQSAVVTAPPPIPVPTVVSPVDYCIGATVAQPLQATGSNLLWYTSATGGTGSVIAPTPATPVTTPSTYYVSQTSFGCESPRAPVNVTVSAPSFSIYAGGPYTFQLGVGGMFNPTLTGITSGQVSSVLWTPPTDLDATNILTPTLTSNVEGTYTYYVAISNAIGCTAIDTALVYVVSECIKVHNAFSPNGDGINELWEVYTTFGCLKNVSVNVYNRYGSKVYENKDYINNWNGNYKCKPVPDGTYYAVIEFELISGKKIVTRTDVTVIR
jgi:gliding motility-associated-like protein